MVKCPNCGSTAQVKINPIAEVDEVFEDVVAKGSCGCGCEFNLIAPIGEFTIDITYTKEKGWLL